MPFLSFLLFMDFAFLFVMIQSGKLILNAPFFIPLLIFPSLLLAIVMRKFMRKNSEIQQSEFPKVKILNIADLIFAILSVLIGVAIGITTLLQSNSTESPINTNPPTSVIKETSTTATKNEKIEPYRHIDSSTWVESNSKYGQYKVKHPDTLTGVQCPTAGGKNSSLCLYPFDNDPPYSGTPVVEIHRYGKSDGNFISKRDFDEAKMKEKILILALKEENTASLVKDENFIGTLFEYEDDSITIISNFTYLAYSGYFQDPEEIGNVLKKITSSFTPLDDPYKCEDPKMSPLKSLPESFSLVFESASDRDITPDGFYSLGYSDTYPASEIKKGENVLFEFSYEKYGNTFTPDVGFLSGISPIQSKNSDPNKPNGVDIHQINCAGENLTDADETPFYIGYETEDPFAIKTYQKKEANDLNNVEEWNLEIQKELRDKVYVDYNNIWQEYRLFRSRVLERSFGGGKPAIFLYPEKTADVEVTIKPEGVLTETDELFDNTISGWKVQVNPEGYINNSLNNHLIYHAAISVSDIPNKGYMVPYEDLIPFLKRYLYKLGLNDLETKEFTKYWSGQLPKANYYFITHLDQKAIEEIYQLSIFPKPDTLIRVEIFFRPEEKYYVVEPPVINAPPERAGFTVVEWGGIF